MFGQPANLISVAPLPYASIPIKGISMYPKPKSLEQLEI